MRGGQRVEGGTERGERRLRERKWGIKKIWLSKKNKQTKNKTTTTTKHARRDYLNQAVRTYGNEKAKNSYY